MKSHLKKLTLVGLVLIFLLGAAVPAFGATQKVRVFVGFAPGGKAAVQQALNAAGADFHYTFDELNSFVVSVPEKALTALSKNPNVVDIEEDVERYPISITPSTGTFAAQADTVDANGQTVPWGVDAVQARQVWDANLDGSFDAGAPTGSGVTVCIIDTGYYSAHEDLAGASLLGGTSQVDNDPFTDGYGHGTHVAGTIAAQNNNFGVIGVAPEISFYIVKYFDNSGAATFASDLIAAANTCASNGADIISMSLGGGRSSGRENRTFANLYAAGVLSIAAAGNDGNTALSYPASYDSVMSVAALDENLAIADFSQQNSQVEIAAPGVAVLSTLPYIETNSLTAGGTTYQANHVEFSARGTGSGTLADGGLCDTVGAWSGQVVLCERGTISFYDKVHNVELGGGAAAVIYNNAPGNFFGTLGDGFTSSIVGISLSQADGQFLVANMLGQSASFTSQVDWPASGYEAWDGTSMATPHVSAVAALLKSANPSATPAEIRQALTATAQDLGAPGRDVAFGYGLVQAADALAYMGGGTTNAAPSVTINSPANNANFTAGDTVNFSGSASDAEDGNLSGSIVWTSSLDGTLGTGASVSFALSAGTHTITASVTDSGGKTATDSITVNVSGGGTGGGALHVAVSTDKASYSKGSAQITVSVTDDGGAAVAGASVSVSITTPSGKIYNGSATTNAAGEATFTYRVNANKDGSGTYSVDATATLTGYTPGSGSTTFSVQ